ncbi:MAG: DoxX family protein [Flavobacterium sp. JAD_PAG50586_2]|nr:MAG: DoxX family protein [Flavobacterium sp. JAD_PAG50586_2]
MKKHKIIFWVTTTIIFLMEGVGSAFGFNSEEAKQGLSHLGYPIYFGNALALFKVAGTLALMIPIVPKRIKEWAYAGFIFDFLFASISYFCVDGVGFFAFLPLIFLVILALSYNSYLKLNP